MRKEYRPDFDFYLTSKNPRVRLAFQVYTQNSILDFSDCNYSATTEASILAKNLQDRIDYFDTCASDYQVSNFPLSQWYLNRANELLLERQTLSGVDPLSVEEIFALAKT